MVIVIVRGVMSDFDLLLLVLLQTALAAVKSIRQEVHHRALPVTAHTNQASLGPRRLLL